MGQELARSEGLTEMQERLVAAMLRGADAEAAKAEAGYSPESSVTIILASRAVQRALEAGCDAKLKGELRLKALKTLDELLDKSTPAATRFQAAKWIAERSETDKKDGDKPLAEMDEAELMAVIERAKQAKDAAMIDVTPKNGAHR